MGSLLGFKVQSLGLRADFPFYVFVKLVVSCEAPAQGISLLIESGAGTHWNFLSAWSWTVGHGGKGEGI